MGVARVVGPTLAGWLLSRDAAHAIEHYGRTPFWASGVIMFIALGLALTVRSERASANDHLPKEKTAQALRFDFW